ncbi:MAG: sensor histidine kinase, partial [Mangrovicoccus sp.]
INKEQGEFTYAISHDWKAPTNTIGMLLEVLLEDFAEEIPAGAMELLKRQQDVVSRMVSLIDDVLKYSISVETALEPEEVHLNEVFEEVLRDLQCQIVDAGSQIDVPKLPLVIGCRTQLRIMFQNLISNAIKFRFPGRPSHVQIKSKHLDDGQLKISVCDNGIGIPQKHCDRIFGLFQRLHAHHEYSGSGLGLAVCKRIAARHGGEITVQSEPDQGSEFSICLKKG